MEDKSSSFVFSTENGVDHKKYPVCILSEREVWNSTIRNAKLGNFTRPHEFQADPRLVLAFLSPSSLKSGFFFS